MTFLWRIIRFGTQNFLRNIWLSLITVLIVTLNLFLISSAVGLDLVGQEALTAVKSKVNLSVYFKVTTADDRLNTIKNDLLAQPDVSKIELITRQQHLEQFRKSQGNKGLIDDVLKQLDENPLGPGLVITAKTLDGYPAIVKALQDPRYASLIEETGNDYVANQQTITKLTSIVRRIQTATIWLTVLFAIIAILMVFNTIRVTIYSQREEIGIMKLVGASDAFVRGPFIFTSLLYGLIASILVIITIFPILSITRPFFDQFFAGYDINFVGYVQKHLASLIGLEIATGCVLSVISSLGAIGRYLRV